MKIAPVVLTVAAASIASVGAFVVSRRWAKRRAERQTEEFLNEFNKDMKKVFKEMFGETGVNLDDVVQETQNHNDAKMDTVMGRYCD